MLIRVIYFLANLKNITLYNLIDSYLMNNYLTLFIIINYRTNNFFSGWKIRRIVGKLPFKIEYAETTHSSLFNYFIDNY